MGRARQFSGADQLRSNPQDYTDNTSLTNERDKLLTAWFYIDDVDNDDEIILSISNVANNKIYWKFGVTSGGTNASTTNPALAAWIGSTAAPAVASRTGASSNTLANDGCLLTQSKWYFAGYWFKNSENKVYLFLGDEDTEVAEITDIETSAYETQATINPSILSLHNYWIGARYGSTHNWWWDGKLHRLHWVEKSNTGSWSESDILDFCKKEQAGNNGTSSSLSNITDLAYWKMESSNGWSDDPYSDSPSSWRRYAPDDGAADTHPLGSLSSREASSVTTGPDYYSAATDATPAPSSKTLATVYPSPTLTRTATTTPSSFTATSLFSVANITAEQNATSTPGSLELATVYPSITVGQTTTVNPTSFTAANIISSPTPSGTATATPNAHTATTICPAPSAGGTQAATPTPDSFTATTIFPAPVEPRRASTTYLAKPGRQNRHPTKTWATPTDTNGT